jgi:uncharacterized membrane protein YccC
MNEQIQTMAEALNTALENIEQNLSNTIDAKFDALEPSEIDEARIREIASEEAADAVDNASVSITSQM